MCGFHHLFHARYFFTREFSNELVNTRAVRKISSHFEYLENRSRDPDATWHPEEALLCIHEQLLSRGASQSAVRRRWLSLCTCDRRIQND